MAGMRGMKRSAAALVLAVGVLSGATAAWADRSGEQLADPSGGVPELWRGRLVAADGTPQAGSVVAYARPSPDRGSQELWRGRLVDPSGEPTKGSVVAYVQPQPARFAELSAGAAPNPTLAQQQQLMVPIAYDEVDASGEFVLVGEFDPALDYMRDETGALSLMIVASSPGNFAISTDTVWWDNGVLTTIDPTIGTTSERAMRASASTTDGVPGERPSDVVMHSAPATGETGTTNNARTRSVAATAGFGPIEEFPFGPCLHFGALDIDLPDAEATVGTNLMKPNRYWHSIFTYETSKTSTFSTSWAFTGGAGPLKFKAAGTTTDGTSSGLGGGFETFSTKVGSSGKRFHITVSMHSRGLVCLVPTLKDPLNVETVAVVGPGIWERDWAFTKTPVPGCARKIETAFRIDPGGDVTRKSGAFASYARSISVTEEIAGQKGTFTGGVTVGFDIAGSEGTQVSHQWWNIGPISMWLCGRFAPVKNGNTEVVAMGENWRPPIATSTTTTAPSNTTTTRPPFGSTTTTRGGGG